MRGGGTSKKSEKCGANKIQQVMTITIEHIWLAIGFLGQGLFFGRWVVQWIASEKKAESQVPISFWYMSLIGGLITLAYAIYRRDPVFIAGQGAGLIVYSRNLYLIYRARQIDDGAGRPTLA